MTGWQNGILVPKVKRMLTAFTIHLRLAIILRSLLLLPMTQVHMDASKCNKTPNMASRATGRLPETKRIPKSNLTSCGNLIPRRPFQIHIGTVVPTGNVMSIN